MLDEALELLAKAPSFVPSVIRLGGRGLRGAGPLAAAAATRSASPPGSTVTSRRTPSPAHIAKYFANATREDGLLARSNAGVVFLPGAAGTVQEIFDNATPNYYESRGEPTPMVLVDRAHWTEQLPAWPLLRALAGGRAMEARIALVDSVDEARRRWPAHGGG